MNRIKRVLYRMLRPGAFWSIPIAAVGIGLLIFVYLTGRQDTLFANISYPITLYTVIVLGYGLQDINQHAKTLISRNKYGAIYLNDAVLRARISLYQGLFFNILFVAFYIYTGWRYASVWFGAVAGYYTILSVIRFVLLRSDKTATLREDKNERLMQGFRSYRLCGFLIFVLNMFMSGVIFQMVWQNKGYHYSELTIYASAGYAFYCLITTIINMVKFTEKESPVLSAARMLSFAGALMSMLSLQTAMIYQFGQNQETFRQIMNAAMGGSILLMVFGMAVYMVIHANHELRKLVNNSQT